MLPPSTFAFCRAAGRAGAKGGRAVFGAGVGRHPARCICLFYIRRRHAVVRRQPRHPGCVLIWRTLGFRSGVGGRLLAGPMSDVEVHRNDKQQQSEG